MVVIIDYNIGNLSSVISALKRVGIDAILSRDKKVIEKAKAIVLPGVGTFPVAMNNLKKYDLIDVLTKQKEAGIRLPNYPEFRVLWYHISYQRLVCQFFGELRFRPEKDFLYVLYRQSRPALLDHGDQLYPGRPL